MATPFDLPITIKPVMGAGPVTSNGGYTTDIISLKDANRVWILVSMNQAAAHATLLTPTQQTDVSATGAKALTNNVQIWANEDTGTSDTLVKQTAAKNYTVTADIKKKLVIFCIEPEALDIANNFDCLSLVVADSSEATDFVDVVFLIDKRTRQATPPSDITD